MQFHVPWKDVLVPTKRRAERTHVCLATVQHGQDMSGSLDSAVRRGVFGVFRFPVLPADSLGASWGFEKRIVANT